MYNVEEKKEKLVEKYKWESKWVKGIMKVSQTMTE